MAERTAPASVNVSLFAYSKTERALSLVERIGSEALTYLQAARAIPEPRAAQHALCDRAFLLNTNTLGGLWKVSPFDARDGTVLSFSGTPIPMDRSIAPAGFHSDVRQRLDNIRSIAGLLPPFFGAFATPEAAGVFTDYLGIGRAYSVETEDFFVASNHIGACLFFLPGAAKEDQEAWQLFSGFGWFVGDSSPFERVSRMPPATIVRFDRRGRKNVTSYFDYESMFEGREPDPAESNRACDEMLQAAENISNLATDRPRVQLSGGRDSRLTAATILATGMPCDVVTVGSITKEAETARSLMERVKRTREHEVVVPSPGSVTQPLPQRVALCMAAWDGDMNPNRLSKRNDPDAIPEAVTIGGGGGELAHGNYYATPELLARVRELERPTDRLADHFAGHAGVTRSSASSIRQFLLSREAMLRRAGMRGPTILDGFYLIERLRRWVAAGHCTNSILLCATHGFVRLSMDQTPEARLRDGAHRELIGRLMPVWRDVPFYKAKPAERDEQEARGLRMWQGPFRDQFFDLLLDGSRDGLWDRSAVLEQAVQVLRGNSEVRMEATFQKVLWRHGFMEHRDRLEARIRRCWERIDGAPRRETRLRHRVVDLLRTPARP